jgi:murein DD-endopeptidase MepM/ murein hydrolase activator NlpD
MVLGKGAALLLVLAKTPAFWLWSAVFCPLLTVLYQAYLHVKKGFMDNLAGHGRLGKLFSHKYVFGVAVITMVSLVSGSNIYASTVGPRVTDESESNLLLKMTVGFEEQLLIENTDYNPSSDLNVGYLDGRALDLQDYYQALETDDTVVPDSDYGLLDYQYSEVTINAVRDIPEPEQVLEVVPTRTRIETYEVQPGDTIGLIARKFGLQTKTLLTSNGLNGWSILSIGRKLKIPPVDGLIYTIKSGDTLNRLAIKYDSDAEEIAEINGISADGLEVGLEIVLPGGEAPAPPPPPPVRTSQYASSHSSSFVAPSPERLSSTKMVWPAGCRRITQYYNRRHFGVDIGCPMRTPIYAADSGTVIFSGWNNGGYGNMVVVDHGGGLYTRYAHHTRNLVTVGETVERGEAIALMGSTGRSTGPHLHFEVLVGSIYNRVNPFDYIQ